MGYSAFLVLILMSSQVATGLALTIFGIGLSSMIGKKYIGTPIDGVNPYYFILLSFLLVIIISYFFKSTCSKGWNSFICDKFILWDIIYIVVE